MPTTTRKRGREPEPQTAGGSSAAPRAPRKRYLNVLRQVSPGSAKATHMKRRRGEPMNDPGGVYWDPESPDEDSDTKRAKEAKKAQRAAKKRAAADDDDDEDKDKSGASSSQKKAKKGAANQATAAEGAGERDDEQRFWLMKAEPETRIEKGRDVRFSIDDLAAKTEPEGWDGIRNHVAAKNLRAMKAGELAFFYHSNCKIPGVAGIMQIVREHSPDETQFDQRAIYYDPKATRDKPRWVWVHVRFVMKFDNLVPLKTLQANAKAGEPLENLQTLKQSRLSVSNVSPEEWEYVLGLAEVTQDQVDAAIEKLGPW